MLSFLAPHITYWSYTAFTAQLRKCFLLTIDKKIKISKNENKQPEQDV